jgi:hypothetical protein
VNVESFAYASITNTEQLPKIWALFMAVVVKNPGIASCDRENNVFNAITALCCIGEWY